MAVKARILGYRRGTNTQYTGQVILLLEGVSAREAHKYIAHRVVYRDRHGNVYRGRIVRKHGARNPTVLAVFEPNLPGQAIGEEAEVL